MNKQQAVIVFDCGATNIRAIAIDQNGKILSSRSVANQTAPDPSLANGRIWDQAVIWKHLALASKELTAAIKGAEVMGVCTTTFGVDGAPFDKDGNILYPVISWACPRTEQIMEELHEVIPAFHLYRISGIAPFSFNTIYKLFWLKKFHPEVISQTRHWLFMPSIINKYLCGEAYTDISMAGTSMLCDHATRDFSEEILGLLGLDRNIFPQKREAGELVGRITPQASQQTGIPPGVPVFAAGHDTQFAIFGSGAGINEPVLSSGTWEILMARTPGIRNDNKAFRAGITSEFDAIPGLYNPGMQWIGSGILEWIKNNFFSDLAGMPDIYDRMINEAREAPGAEIEIGLDFINNKGMLSGLSLSAQRGQIYFSALKALAMKTAKSLKTLEESCGFKASSLRVAGGGSKNSLWNELRAETTGIPVKPISQAETTVMGAAMFAFCGAGVYPSPEDARKAFLSGE